MVSLLIFVSILSITGQSEGTGRYTQGEQLVQRLWLLHHGCSGMPFGGFRLGRDPFLLAVR